MQFLAKYIKNDSNLCTMLQNLVKKSYKLVQYLMYCNKMSKTIAKYGCPVTNLAKCSKRGCKQFPKVAKSVKKCV